MQGIFYNPKQKDVYLFSMYPLTSMWENVLSNHFGLEHKNQFVFLEHCLYHSAEAIHALNMPKTPGASLPLPNNYLGLLQFNRCSGKQSIKIDLNA